MSTNCGRLGINPIDPRGGRSIMRQSDKLRDGILIALDQSLDTAIGAIAHPPATAKALRRFHRPCAIPDALNPACDRQAARAPGH